jgi:Xaa-Pro aminopeptidase
MTFTVEPGVYLPGWGGIRIEDIVILEATGARPLSRASK